MINTKRIKDVTLIALVAAGVAYLYAYQSIDSYQKELLEGPPEIIEPGAPRGDSAAPTSPPGTAPGTTAPRRTSPSAVTSGFVRFVSPMTSDTWAIGTNHAIVWSTGAGAPGGLKLFTASGKEAGWILPNTTAGQMSFSWNTRDASVTRTGGTRNPVAPGAYRIALTFDGKAPDIWSETFTIIAEGGTETLTYPVRLKDVKVTPNVLTVPQGARVVFINNDALRHTISFKDLLTFPIAPGGIYTLDTTTLPKGTHNYFSDVYTYQAPGTLIIE